MIPLRKRFLMLLLGAMLLPVFVQQTANAAPAFSIPEAPKFSYPLPDNTLNEFTFFVFSTEGNITGSTVQVRDVKTADGDPRGADAVKAVLESGTVTPGGQKVTLTLDPKYFTVPAEYRITLSFSGANGTPALLTTVTINRLAADINFDELKDQTVTLTRPIPWWPASGEFTYHLRETGRRVTLTDLKLSGQSIYLKDTKERVSGSVAAAPLPYEGKPVNVPPGGVQPLKVSFWDLWRAGSFDTKLLITSTSLSGEKAIPIKVNVRDWVLFPLLAIAIGVAGGYLTRRLVGVERPRNENTFKLLRLQNEVERFREVVSKPSSVETVSALLAQIKKAKESNATGDFATVKAELPKIQEKLDEFRKAQLQAQEAANTTLNGQLNEVEVLEQDELTPDEVRDLESIKGKLTDVQRLLRQGMVDDAQDKLENVKQLLAAFRTRKLTDYFSFLTTELGKLSLTGDAATTGESLKSEIAAALNGKDLNKAREKLATLKTFVETKKAEASSLKAGAKEAGLKAVLPGVPRALPQDAVLTRIIVVTPLEKRIAGTTITFTIEDPEQLIDKNDRLQWFFGEVGFSVTQATTNTHRYDESGHYEVRVDILKDGTPAKTLSEFITIAPGDIEQARATVLQNILRNELLLSIIALVLAIISGVLFLYVGKVFGTLVDYLGAILWGFGIDNSIKGFAAILAKISAPE